MHLKINKTLFTGLIILTCFSVSSANELKSRYTTIMYSNEDQVRRFNNEVSLGSLSYLLRNRGSVTTGDEVKNKVDVIIERVESVLEMYPKALQFHIVLLPSDSEVQAIFRKIYGKDADYIAFYSPKDKTVYLSVKDIEVTVLAHEFGHMIIDFYYDIATSEKIHEVLAQYVEEHLKKL
jgi:hypothetical protein